MTSTQLSFGMTPLDETATTPNARFGFPDGLIDAVSKAARAHLGRQAAAAAAIGAVAKWDVDHGTRYGEPAHDVLVLERQHWEAVAGAYDMPASQAEALVRALAEAAVEHTADKRDKVAIVVPPGLTRHTVIRAAMDFQQWQARARWDGKGDVE